MSSLALKLQYSRAQTHMFFTSARLGRFRIFPKGRRLGATRGAAHALIEFCLEGKACLWGDTINANIDRYVDRYFKPVLERDRVPYSWNQQKRLLKIGNGYIDFRSSDNPENWEGFGYDIVFLNEAGIILEGTNGRYLYQNAVLPMLMDKADSQLIAAGVPKGMAGSLFYELWIKAKRGEPGYYTTKRPFNASDNPWIPPGSYHQLLEEMLKVGGQVLVDQEGLGKFVNADNGEAKVIPMEWIRAAQARWAQMPRPRPGLAPDAIGGDVARGGQDSNAMAHRWGDWIGELVTARGTATPDGAAWAAWCQPFCGAHTSVHVDVVGVGTSPYDHLKRVHPRTYPFNGGQRTPGEMDRAGLLELVNLRALAYWRLREQLNPDYGATLALPPDEEMAEDLNAASWKLTPQGILIEPKDAIKKRLGRSPDKGDAVAMATWVPSVEAGRAPGGW